MKTLDAPALDLPALDGSSVLAARPLVVELGDGAASDAALVGGKAVGLERLMTASLPCPPAFCVTAAALDLYLGEAGLRERVSALLDGAPNEHTLREARTLAFAHELPVQLSAALTGAAGRLCSRLTDSALLAVRSSASSEDGGTHSFAGLYETSLGVQADGLVAAVRSCWASLWSQGALAYRRERRLSLLDAAMAVVVQALVPAQASAVVFTAHPLTGATDELLIHATSGLGCALVENRITPDTAVLARSDLALRRLELGEKHLRIDARSAGGLLTTHGARREPALSEDQLRRLARLAIEVEHVFGSPVDVEAAFSGSWQLIQARPITTLRIERAR
jgi:phosphoenolpyruvate synthase/pyruvate phosphate dikinase